MTHQKTLKQEFTDFLKIHAISQAKAAEGCGYTPGVLSGWISDSYKGDTFAVEGTIRSWLEREGRRRARKTIPVANTESFNRITKAITLAHENKDIALVVGEAGFGKTTALKAYAEANPHNAIYINVNKAMTKQTLIYEIAAGLGFERKGNFPDVAMRVHQKLAEQDMVVMVDEADYLKDDSLELLRQIVNDAGQSGLVLSGLPRLEYRIITLKNDHQQIASRIGVYAAVAGLRELDAQNIVLSAWPNLVQDRETQKAFWKGCGPSARRLSKLIENAHRTCMANNLEMPTAEVVAAAGALILDDTKRRIA